MRTKDSASWWRRRNRLIRRHVSPERLVAVARVLVGVSKMGENVPRGDSLPRAPSPLPIRGKSTPKNLRGSRLYMRRALFRTHRNGGRIYLNGVSRAREIYDGALDALQRRETFGSALKRNQDGVTDP